MYLWKVWKFNELLVNMKRKIGINSDKKYVIRIPIIHYILLVLEIYRLFFYWPTYILLIPLDIASKHQDVFTMYSEGGNHGGIKPQSASNLGWCINLCKSPSSRLTA